MGFPQTRMRRLRRTEALRQLRRETTLDAGDLIVPLFVRPGNGVKQPVASMPGVYQYSIDMLRPLCEQAQKAELGGILLFGIPDHKDGEGRSGYEPHGIVQESVRAIKAEFPQLGVVTDVCTCAYTTHGHCGTIVNDAVDN